MLQVNTVDPNKINSSYYVPNVYMISHFLRKLMKLLLDLYKQKLNSPANFWCRTTIPHSIKIHSVVLEYKGVSKSFWTGHLEQKLQMVQLSATRCSGTAIL
jgi:hypothetical protein